MESAAPTAPRKNEDSSIKHLQETNLEYSADPKADPAIGIPLNPTIPVLEPTDADLRAAAEEVEKILSAGRCHTGGHSIPCQFQADSGWVHRRRHLLRYLRISNNRACGEEY